MTPSPKNRNPVNQTWLSRNEAETFEVGGRLVADLPDGAIVSLEGTLGAGKSVLVRGMAAGMGVDPELVTSPTFTLWQTYQGSRNRELHHLDAYRLLDANQLIDLGVEELFQSDGIAVIEWGEKVRAALPLDHYRVMIEIDEHGQRKIVLIPPAER
jgi:tRNA threonylcarbamoyladenosine biosynthesis protein TsaE